MVLFDKEILDFIIQNRVSLLSPIMIWMEYIGHQIVIAIITTLLFLYKKNYPKLIILWATLATSVIITYILKNIIQRSRPLVEILIQKTGYSFPSGHTTLAFAVLPLLNKEFPKLKYLWISFATLIAFSRLYLGIHFPSDVIAGAIIGYLIGNLILYIQEHYSKFYEK